MHINIKVAQNCMGLSDVYWSILDGKNIVNFIQLMLVAIHVVHHGYETAGVHIAIISTEQN